MLMGVLLSQVDTNTEEVVVSTSRGRLVHTCPRFSQADAGCLRSEKSCGAKKKGLAEAKPLNLLVGRTGFEPVTNGLKVRCSTS